MKTALKIALLFIGGTNAALSLAGCKASACPDTQGPDGGTETHPDCVQLEPLKQYKGQTPRTASLAWASGKNITIHNVNGNNANGPGSSVSADGPADMVTLSAISFRYGASSDQQKATDFLTSFASPTITADAAGNLVVNGPGDTGVGGDGYIMTVHIPSTFDAALVVQQDQGIGLEVHGAATGKSTTVTSGGSVTVTGVTGSINVSASTGDVTVSATPSGPGNVIHTDVGDINASIGMSNLAITAKTELGTVMFPAAWMAKSSADMASGSATIGDGSGALSVTSGNGSIFFQ